MRPTITSLTLAMFALSTIGCGPKSTETSSPNDTTTSAELPPSTADVHSHPSEGPHHGSLVELGNEEFHAEITHDQESVTVYILDAAATTTIPIEASELTINLVHDGNPEQFKLAANPDSEDPEGMSSRFSITKAELVGHLDDESAAPKLSVTIRGTPYRGEIKHDHDHDDHDHAH